MKLIPAEMDIWRFKPLEQRPKFHDSGNNGVIGPNKKAVLGGWNKKLERNVSKGHFDTFQDSEFILHPISTKSQKLATKPIWRLQQKDGESSSKQLS